MGDPVLLVLNGSDCRACSELPPDQIANNFKRKGWAVEDRRPPVCPDCIKRKKMPAKETAAPAPTRIGPDLKLARRVMARLDEHFDEATRLYRGGWSDARAAQEDGVSIEAVKTIRREAYGELAEDQAVTDIREEIELLRLWVDDEVKKLQSSFSSRVADLGKMLAVLQTKRPA